jgi:hypothetical protein
MDKAVQPAKAERTSKARPFEIGGQSIPAGSQATIDLPVSVLSDHTQMMMTVQVVHGRRPGPVIFVSAAVHGDEVIGVEIVRRLLRSAPLKSLQGTLLAVPVVNGFGFTTHSRYLPDRRDLNRSFPGSPRGSLAGRLADLFTKEILKRADVGIDLHSAAVNRTNLPQIRISSDKPSLISLAEAFAAPLILVSPVREGSLRAHADSLGKDVLLFEAGEGLRFDEMAIRAGVAGILRVMHKMSMLPKRGVSSAKTVPLRARKSSWERAQAGGLHRAFKTIGEVVKKDDILGIVSDPLGEVEEAVLAGYDGLIIGRSNLPVVHEGDALFHIAKIDRHKVAEAAVEELASQLESEHLFDEDEII